MGNQPYKIILWEIPIKHGSLKIEGQEVFGIKGKRLRVLRKDIGIIFQDYKLINEFTIEENIMIPLKIKWHSHEISKDQANKLLAHVRLSHRSGYYPNELSGGEQQRVAVAGHLHIIQKLSLLMNQQEILMIIQQKLFGIYLKGANEQLGITVEVVTHRVPKNLGIKFRQLSIEDGIIYEVSKNIFAFLIPLLSMLLTFSIYLLIDNVVG